MALRQVVVEPDKPIRWIYFPATGVASVIANAKRDRQIEVGIIGRDGMTALSVLHGSDRSINQTFFQVEGYGFRMAADDFRKSIGKSASLQAALLRYAEAFALQTTFSALTNARGNIEERLARWLLMTHDRVDGDRIELTHEFLSLMLGVRRAGVTTALHSLERRRLINAERGCITVEDRAGMEELARGLYGIVEAEQQRLTGWRGKH